MDHNLNDSINAKAGTIGGTLLIILINIRTEDILNTALLAAVGAVVSFIVSMVLKNVLRLIRKK